MFMFMYTWKIDFLLILLGVHFYTLYMRFTSHKIFRRLWASLLLVVVVFKPYILNFNCTTNIMGMDHINPLKAELTFGTRILHLNFSTLCM